MELIDRTIGELRECLAGLPGRDVPLASTPWPRGGPRNIVLGEDVGLELGNPWNHILAEEIRGVLMPNKILQRVLENSFSTRLLIYNHNMTTQQYAAEY